MPFLQLDAVHEWSDGDYVVTTDRSRVDRDVVHRYLAEESYWAKGRAREVTDQVIDNSRCYALVHVPTGAQVGFARVLTDGCWFGWIGDVFVLPEHRGGRGKFLVQCVMEDLASVRRVSLGTYDAHGLYAQFGFTPVEYPERWMERFSPGA
jgi:GNAT superfamily N-acetyltransferase